MRTASRRRMTLLVADILHEPLQRKRVAQSLCFGELISFPSDGGKLQTLGSLVVEKRDLSTCFHDLDFLRRQAIERIHQLVYLSLQGANIDALSATVVRLSWFRRRCNESILTLRELWRRECLGVGSFRRFENSQKVRLLRKQCPTPSAMTPIPPRSPGRGTKANMRR
jgi:hypothetical protein